MHGDGPEVRSPSALLDAMAADWRRDPAWEDFSAGCPLAAAAADTAGTSEPLRQAVGQAFREWQAPLSEGLAALGVPSARAGPFPARALGA